MNNDDADGSGNGAEPPASSEDAAAPEAAPAAAPETLEQRVTRLEREKSETHDRMLRVAADFENYKRRAKRDVDDATFRAKEQVLREVLPVLDNLDRALQATSRGGTVEALAQGVKLVEKQLLGGLEKFGIKGFEAKGQPFDPSRHEAIQQVETDAVAPGTVAEEFARGYVIGDRLLRPAMVAVAKALATAADSSASDAGGTGDGEHGSDGG
jgi:molecular chaperone GrpE